MHAIIFSNYMSIDVAYRYPSDEFVNDSVRATQYVASYEHVSVLSPKEPYWDGWLLLIPNEITEKIEDIPDTVLLEMFSVVHALHELFVRKDEFYEGFMFFGNRGLGAGQQVPHAHFHFVPRFTNRGAHHFRDRARHFCRKISQST